MKVSLTIRNYRCFVRPTTIDIARDFTAFVGINNAGKSALMRFLLEFRVVLTHLAGPTGEFINSLRGSQRMALNQVLDHLEVFSNRNSAPVEFEFRFQAEAGDDAGPATPEVVKCSYSRGLELQTRVRLRTGLDLGGEPLSQNGHQFVTQTNPQRIFNANPLFSIARRLSETLYIGPFRNALNVGTNENYIDIEIGEAFITKFRQYKNGNIKAHNDAMLRLTDDLRKIFEFETLSIDTTPDNKSLHIAVNGKSYKQHELGSGLIQFLIVMANASIRNPSYILIDEPELNLHPRLQLDFLTTLGRYAKEGVWFSTHSIGLARSITDKIYSVRRITDGDSQVTLLDGTPSLSEFLGEMSFSSHKELGFDKLLLVEGSTEVKAVQQVLRKFGKDHKFVLLSLSGRINGEMALEIEEIQRLTDRIAALIDSERSAADLPLAAPRQAFVDLCAARGIACHVLERRATENYFPDAVVKEVFGTDHRGLGPYEDFSTVRPKWSKNENCRLAGAMTREQLLETDLGVFLHGL